MSRTFFKSVLNSYEKIAKTWIIPKQPTPEELILIDKFRKIRDISHRKLLLELLDILTVKYG